MKKKIIVSGLLVIIIFVSVVYINKQGLMMSSNTNQTAQVVTGTSVLTVVKIGSGTGMISSGGSSTGLISSCSSSCSVTVSNGTSVTLKAYPQGGSTFIGGSGWLVNGSPCTQIHGGTCTVVLNSDTTVSAEFIDPSQCVSLTLAPINFNASSAQGISNTFTVNPVLSCNWSAISNNTWIHTASTGTGNGVVSYTLDSNTSTSARAGTITVNGQTFKITQAGAAVSTSCKPDVNNQVIISSPVVVPPATSVDMSGIVNIHACALNADHIDFYLYDLNPQILIGSISGAEGDISFNTTTATTQGAHSIMAEGFSTNDSSSPLSTYPILPINIINSTDPGTSKYLKEVGRSTGTGSAVSNAVKTDSFGNSVVVGNFNGTVIFGDPTNTGCPGISCHSVTASSLGGSDIFIEKFNADGVLQWVKTYGGTSDDKVTSVAINKTNGNIYVTGYFVGTANFGSGSVTSGDGIYGSDVFTAGYNSNGNSLWVKTFSGPFGNNYGNSISVDSLGNVIVGGNFYTQINFGGGPVLSQGGSLDDFLVKLNGSTGGNIIVNTVPWVVTFGGLGADYLNGVDVDSNGDVIAVGYGYAGMNFGAGTVAGLGGSDIFITKYAGSDGHYVWSHVFGGTGSDLAQAVSVDSSKNIYVTGIFSQTADFGGISQTAPVDTSAFLAKYNSTGNLQWIRSFGPKTSQGGVTPHGIAIDSSGNVAVIGNASGGVDFGNGVLSYGDGSVFINKLDTSGKYIWSKRSSNSAWGAGYGIAIDEHKNITTGLSERNVLATGDIQGTFNIDSISASSPGINVQSAFLYKVSP